MTHAATTPDVSIVVPVYGCAGCLEDLVDRCLLACAGRVVELLLVDDASPDGAWARITELAARHAAVRGVKLSRNFGQHAAIRAGLAHARGARVVVMDCDLQDRPEEIPALLQRLDDCVDVVQAQRTGRRDGWRKRLASRLFYALLSWLGGAPFDHRIANFGAYSRRVVDLVLAMPESDSCFPLMVRWTGLPATTVEVTHAARAEGDSSYTLRRSLRLALAIVLSHSDKALRMVVALGLGVSGVALAVVLAAVVLFFSGYTGVAGYTSIIASIWLLGGILLSSLGVVGLYVGQVFRDVKARPAYVVDRVTADA